MRIDEIEATPTNTQFWMSPDWTQLHIHTRNDEGRLITYKVDLQKGSKQAWYFTVSYSLARTPRTRHKIDAGDQGQVLDGMVSELSKFITKVAPDLKQLIVPSDVALRQTDYDTIFKHLATQLPGSWKVEDLTSMMTAKYTLRRTGA